MKKAAEVNLPPFTKTLKDGTPVLIREVTQDDRHLLEFGFAHLSKSAKYFRFLGAHKNLSEKELDTFIATNTPDHFAVSAMMVRTPDPKPIGIARYMNHFDGAKTTHTSPKIEVRFPTSLTLDPQATRSGREKPKFEDPNKPASVWEDDGGAILKLFADLKRAIDKREIRSKDMSLSHQPACFSTLSQGAALFRLCLF